MDAHTKLTYGVDNKLSKIDTLIADARPAREAGKVSLESHGFTLEPQKTSLRTRDFFDVESGIVEKVYYAEMRAAVRRATGADEVLILEHIVRDAGAADTRGAKNPFASGGNGINGYAGVVHTDFRQDRAYQLARSKGSGKKEFGSSQRDRQRFMIVNTWRNISDEHLIYDNTLALCDGKTVDERALLPCDVHHPNGKSSEQYRLDAASAEAARWYYFPHMAKDELLIFKQFDSDLKALARYCFHTAFHDPVIPKDAPTRQSCEVRCIALFSDAMTAPPPVARNLSDEVFEARVLPKNRQPAAHEVQHARGAPVVAEREAAVAPVRDDDEDEQLALALAASRMAAEEDTAMKQEVLRGAPVVAERAADAAAVPNDEDRELVLALAASRMAAEEDEAMKQALALSIDIQ